MYSTPFGSIFGDSSEPLKKKAPAQQIKPLPSADPTKDPLKERKETLRKSKVIKPGDSASLDVTNKVIPASPEVELAEATLEQKKTHLKFGRLKRAIAAIKADIKKAELYRTLLLQYNDLTAEEKQEIELWALKNRKAIDAFGKARKLIKETTLIKEKIKDIDIDISHWDTLKALKKKGKLATKSKVKRVRGINLRTKGDIPRFAAGRSEENKQLAARSAYGLDRLKKIDQTLDGLFEPGTQYQIRNALQPVPPPPRLHKPVKEAPKMSLYSLPEGERQRIEAVLTPQPRKELIPTPAAKKAEMRWADAKQLEWKKRAFLAEHKELQAKYKELLQEVQDLVQKIIDEGDEKAAAVTATLGILSEGKPDHFLKSETLFKGLSTFFKSLRVSQLSGDLEADPGSAEQEALKFLASAKQDHTAARQEMQTRQYALTTAVAAVKDLPPPPPPPPIKVEITVKADSEGIGISMNHVLLAVAGAWVLSKVL